MRAGVGVMRPTCIAPAERPPVRGGNWGYDRRWGIGDVTGAGAQGDTGGTH